MEKNLEGISANSSPKIEPGFLRHVRACNAHDPARYRRFYIGNRPAGYIRQDFCAVLEPFATLRIGEERIDFTGDSDDLAQVTQALHEAGYLKLRHELYAVKEEWSGETLTTIDRGAVWFFGIAAYGVHINGVVRKTDGLHLWIARRALDRQVDPGKRDCMVGGGMTAGLTPMQVVIKEAAEEAGLPEAIAGAAQPVGAVSYRFDFEGGLKSDTLFIYDLFLDESVMPKNTDGEIQGFALMPIAEVARLVRDTDEFKFNCNLVITDFLIRHGYLNAGDAEYVELCRAL